MIKKLSLNTLILSLLLFGLVMIYNTTVVYSQEVLGSAYRLVILQAGWILVGGIGFFIFRKISIEKLKKITFPLFIIAVAFLGFMALANIFSNCESGGVIFAPCINGAHRWFYFNPPPLPALPVLGVLGFQPSEFAKLAFVLYLALILEKNIRNKENPFGVFLITSAIVAGLVILQPNMSTAFLLLIIGFSIYFVSGASLIPLYTVGPIFFILGLVFMFSSDYRRQRLLTFLKPGESGDLTLGYHIRQIQIALGSGGLFGLGFGQSRQKFQYLPEVAADSIFAVVGEEFGFFGTTIFIILFSALIIKGYSIAKETGSLYEKLLATGITTWLAVQFFVNIAAMTRLIPLTGIPLPLVSYGGSSMIFSLVALGILSNIASRLK